MAKHKFLTEEWVAEVRRIREENPDAAPAPAHSVRMNQVITAVPFGDGDIESHLDTSGGELVLELGHLDEVDLTVTLDYDTAKAILVEGNPQAGMQALMAGKITVVGDVSKLMALSAGAPTPEATLVAQQIQAITE